MANKEITFLELQKEKENLEGNNIIQFSVTSSIKDDDWEILVAQSINF